MKRQTLAVRPWTAADSQIASGWWQDCWTSAGVAAADVPPPAGTVELGGCAASLLAITLDGTTSGLVAASEKVGLVVIALRADARGWGYGSEAVSLVEKRSSPSRAFASPRVGLSLYFWLRLGYAPSDEQPYAPHALMLEKAT